MATRDIVFIALFAALMAALGLFPPLMIPGLGIPITAQSMGPMLIGGILGARRGFLSMLLFLALVAIGMPLLAGGRGGLAAFVGPWSGFIYGWALAVLVIGFLIERVWSRLDFVRAFGICVLGGIGIIYGVGVPWYSAMSGMGLVEAFTGSMADFYLTDAVARASDTMAKCSSLFVTGSQEKTGTDG